MSKAISVQSSEIDFDASAGLLPVSMGRKLCVLEAARHLGISKSFLDKRRIAGTGPAYLKIGRRVMYDLRDLELYALRAKRRNTSSA